MRILAVSDQPVESLYNPEVRKRLGKIDLILGCGDLPYYYLEYLLTMLDAPLYYVHGNHDPLVEYTSAGGTKSAPEGADNVDLRCVNVHGLLIAGLEGCIRYKPDARHQFTQNEMSVRALGLLPGLALNRLSYGRWLDVLIAHSPPQGIHNGSDHAHTGFSAFLDLMRIFKPRYLLHGHQHRNYGPGPGETCFEKTLVVNVHPYRILEVETHP